MECYTNTNKFRQNKVLKRSIYFSYTLKETTNFEQLTNVDQSFSSLHIARAGTNPLLKDGIFV